MNRPIEITETHLSQFSSDVESLWVKPIITLDSPPSPIHFLREYVNLSVPVIIKNAFPSVTLDELVESLGDGANVLNLHVDVTPDGHGDTIRKVDGEKMFVMPEVRTMSFIEFTDRLRKQRIISSSDSPVLDTDENGLRMLSSTNRDDSTSEVFYYSRQVSM